MDTDQENRDEGFVAMWFGSDAESKAKMDELYECVIAPAIAESGFVPYRVDRDYSVDNLHDAITEGINRAAFLVADITHAPETGLRGNVFFEAGYAYGKKPIIWMCKDDVAHYTPFDTSQFRQIRWNVLKLDEAREELTNVIGKRMPKSKHGPHIDFGRWLSREGSLLYQEIPSVSVGPELLPSGATQIGDSLVISTALSYRGWESIETFPEGFYDSKEFRNVVLAKNSLDRTNWERERAELKQRDVRGIKLRVRKISPPTSDEDTFRVQCDLAEYADVRSFHSVVERDSNVAIRYLTDAMSVRQPGSILPNALSNHIVVVFGRPNARNIILCHRSINSPVGYWGGRWSASIEEQYNATFTSERGNADSSIQESVERGVREELIGKHYSGSMNVYVQGFQMETHLLNYGFLAVVDLPDLEDFDELEKLWLDALDREEHAAIAALPLQRNVIEDCLGSSELSSWVRSMMRVSKGFDPLNTEDSTQLWHPTSPVRLALALWFSQQTGA